jgi:hypothetical protein
MRIYISIDQNNYDIMIALMYSLFREAYLPSSIEKTTKSLNYAGAFVVYLFLFLMVVSC